MVKGHLSAGGAAIGAIFIVFSILLKTTFWIQIICFYFAFLFGEVFFGPSYAQINMVVQSQIQGLAVSIFVLVGALAGSLITFILGYLGDKYDIANNPEILGKLLGSAILAAYLGCIPFFLKNAQEYAKLVRYQRQIIQYAEDCEQAS